jgi:hypothetical protein
MKYLILTYESKDDFEARCGNEARQGQYWSARKAYIDSMSHAGIIDSMHALLEDYTATTVRLREGKRQLHDGPYADTDEQIGSYFVIEVANLDRALEWAELCPAAASGAVEVRPLDQIVLEVNALGRFKWWTWSGSNRRPLPCHGSALPTAPQAHNGWE